MSNQTPTSINPKSFNTIILNWCSTTLHNLHVAIPNQHFKNGEKITITVHPDGCLLLYPIATWTPIENIFKKLSSTKIGASRSEATLFERLFNNVSNETIHDQRVGIPESFLAYAALENEVIWAETDSHVQLWQPARFAEKITQAQQNQPTQG